MPFSENIASIKLESNEILPVSVVKSAFLNFYSSLDQKIFDCFKLIPPDVNNGIATSVALNFDRNIADRFVKLAVELAYHKNA